jgi:hypothetical protein
MDFFRLRNKLNCHFGGLSLCVGIDGGGPQFHGIAGQDDEKDGKMQRFSWIHDSPISMSIDSQKPLPGQNCSL